MPILTVQGTWYGARCAEFTGVYVDLGNVSHTNYSLIQTGVGVCTGFNFIVVDNTNGSTLYTSTSSGKDLALFFDGSLVNERYDCVNGICTPASTSGLSGAYESLEACELVCGVNPEGLICMTPGEFGIISQQLKKAEKEACD